MREHDSVEPVPDATDMDQDASAATENAEDLPLGPEEAHVASQAFVAALTPVWPLSANVTFVDLMGWLSEAARQTFRATRDERSIGQALSKLRGDWFEWLLCIAATNCERDSEATHVAVRLPNVSQFDAAQLYETVLAQMIQDLRAEVRKSDVELITSNPDFVLLPKAIAHEDPAPVNLTADLIKWHNERHLRFVQSCRFVDIRGYLAAKYTLRPDRRLQMAHEGSLMKALYVHLQTRLWITKPRGLSFFAVSTKVGPADRNGLRTVATHSITSVASTPQPAVDRAFEVKTIGDAEAMFREILR